MPNLRSYSTSRGDSSSIIRLCRRPVLSSQAELLVPGRDLGHAGRLHGGSGTLYRVSPAAAEHQLRAAAAAAGPAGDAADPATTATAASRLGQQQAGRGAALRGQQQ